jgi:hypothetical protein
MGEAYNIPGLGGRIMFRSHPNLWYIFHKQSDYTVTCMVVRVTNKMGSSSDDCIY